MNEEELDTSNLEITIGYDILKKILEENECLVHNQLFRMIEIEGRTTQIKGV